ncbi:HK97 family phage prohead protease [Salinisphaera orenii]|uniref:HK97 family phage prohead protease n=1 Tax=Salinisphaera orenii TaxID=856731 RepID=UPI001C845C7A|nr:HK97 family phage prohead protease [Salinisphaera orenii]
MYNRLYSTLRIKAADSDGWTFTGIASTPTPDRMRDTVDPKGAQFSLPIPLLWQHDHGAPIGDVKTASITDAGIEISASITQPTDDMPRGMTGRLQEAWASIKSGLVRGLSIGFVPKAWEPREDGGMAISAWDWLELSAVTVPANQDASIQTIKSLSASMPTPITTPHHGFSLRKTHFILRNG